ncbi:MAG: chemotaxis protein CheW [Planctomycetota bacterium]
MSPGDELFDIFAKEMEEHLQALETCLLGIEQAPAAADAETINSVLRACHSMKGACGFFGYDHIGKISHAMENVFEKVRDRELTPDDAFIGVMLGAVDRLKTVAANLEAGREEKFTAEIDAISRYLVSGETSALETVRSERGGMPDFTELAPTPDQARQAVRFGKKVYCLAWHVGHDIFGAGRRPDRVAADCAAMGEVLAAVPPPDELARLTRGGTPDWAAVLLATVLAPDLVAGELGLPAGQVWPVALPTGTPAAPPATAAVTAAAGAAEPEEGTGAVRTGPISRKGALRVRTDLLDDLMKVAGELVLERNQLLESSAAAQGTSETLGAVVQNINRITTELQNMIIKTRMQPLDVVFRKFPRMVRDIARDLGKRIRLEIEGADVELDSSIVENISDPLVHLVRNACDHGIEAPDIRRAAGKSVEGLVRFRAYYEGEQVTIDIEDDGKGMDADRIGRKAVEKGLVTAEVLRTLGRGEILAFVFTPGFSTAEKVTTLSGRGVGMDVVSANVGKLGGSVQIDSLTGRGTRFSLRLPLTLAIIPTLTVRAVDQRFAILQSDIKVLLRLKGDKVRSAIGKVRGIPVLLDRDELVPLVRLADVLGLPRTFNHPETGERLSDRRHAIADRRAEDLIVNGEGRPAPATTPAYKRVDQDRRADQEYLVVVLRFHDKTYGLIVDGKENIEEMVIKPLPVFLKDCPQYSGASVRGDGRVVLVLDINGIARMAGLHFGDMERAEQREQERRRRHLPQATEAVELLLVRIKSGEQLGLPLDAIRRVQEVERTALEQVGDRLYVQHEGRSLRVVELDRFVPATPSDRPVFRQFLVIPRVANPVGFLVAAVVDTLDLPVDIDRETIRHPHLFGTAIINGKTVLLPDLFAILDTIDADRAAGRPMLPAGPRVLLAEDTPFWRTIMVHYLEGAGCRVVCAGDGREALAALGRETADLVITDLALPNMNGFQLLDELRNDPALKHLPVLGVTTLSAKGALNEALRGGFNACAVKIQRDELVAAAARLLG